MTGSPQKEASAFVDRLATRLKADPRAALSGRQRAAFIAVRPLVEAALNGGYTMKATWEALRDEGRLSMTYETFRGHCRQLRPKRSSKASPGGAGAATSQKPESTAGHPQVDAPAPADGSSTENQRRGFQHERMPQKHEIY